jgi:hypothetical protein
MFEPDAVLQVESSGAKGLSRRDAILPEMIQNIGMDSFAAQPQHED